MAHETQAATRLAYALELWPPDDSEESVVGTDLHQTTIINLRLGINEIAQSRRQSGQPVPWHALDQTVLLGCRRRDGTAHRTQPDVFVYPHAIDSKRGSMALALDGPPVLIIEVLSESTYASDIDLNDGKGYSYARAGVREYMALDPTREYLSVGIQAWRLVDGVYQPWEPDAAGRWQSAEIAVAIGIEGALAAVYTSEGQRMLREGEVAAEMERRDETLERQVAEIERLRRQIQELGG